MTRPIPHRLDPGQLESAPRTNYDAPAPTDNFQNALGDILASAQSEVERKYREAGGTPQGVAKDVGLAAASYGTGFLGLADSAGRLMTEGARGPGKQPLPEGPLSKLDDKIWDEMSPLGKSLSFADPKNAAKLATLPALGRLQGRGFKFWHGTSPERAERLIKEGFTTGGSAHLGLPGTSLSRDPNVSLHRFARGDPAGLLVVDVPTELQAQARNMSVADFVDTPGFLEKHPDLGIYNKPSTLYKELETFVRRERTADPSGQYNLFRASDQIKARRPTPEELRYAQKVSKGVGEGHRKANEMSGRNHLATHTTDPEWLHKTQISGEEAQKLRDLGMPTPSEVISAYSDVLGSGSSTSRARIFQDMDRATAGLPFNPRITDNNTLTIKTWNIPGMPEVGARPFVVLKNGVPHAIPFPKYGTTQFELNRAAAHDKTVEAVGNWYNEMTPATKRAMRLWDTPKGKRFLQIQDEGRMVSSELYKGKEAVESGLQIKRDMHSVRETGHGLPRTGRERGFPSRQFGTIERTTVKPSLSDDGMRFTLEQRVEKAHENYVGFNTVDHQGDTTSRSLNVSVKDLQNSGLDVRRLDDHTLTVDPVAFSDFLTNWGNGKIKQGIKAREVAIKKLEGLL